VGDCILDFAEPMLPQSKRMRALLRLGWQFEDGARTSGDRKPL